MRRRGFVKALATLPAVPAMFAQQPSPAPAPAGAATPRPASDELPVLTPSVPDEAAEMMPRFFTPEQFSALRRVSEVLMPGTNGGVGASEAKAPEFLDFLIGESPADRQQLYRNGLDALNVQSKKRFNKTYGELDVTQAEGFLAPLRQPWTFDEPADPIANFLRIAKQDVRTATVNSREFSAAGAGTAGGGRRSGGGGLYWYPLD